MRKCVCVCDISEDAFGVAALLQIFREGAGIDVLGVFLHSRPNQLRLHVEPLFEGFELGREFMLGVDFSFSFSRGEEDDEGVGVPCGGGKRRRWRPAKTPLSSFSDEEALLLLPLIVVLFPFLSISFSSGFSRKATIKSSLSSFASVTPRRRRSSLLL